ncbi:MAG: outer membrane protein assembly factor BamE [Planctomycetota bacterium]|nr:outer membrane protein assembly factor BamE [Planctomycetota bacterium]
MKNALALSLALVASSLLSACIVNVDSHKERTGRYVSSATLQQIEPGRSQDYVRALLGEPTSRTKVEAATEIWKWTYSETKTRQGQLIFVFDTDESERVEGATYVEFQDGLVRKTWQD